MDNIFVNCVQTRKLAAKLGITAYYLSYIENGVKSNPNKRIIARMFTELNMSKSEIECFLDLHAKANGCVSYDRYSSVYYAA